MPASPNRPATAPATGMAAMLIDRFGDESVLYPGRAPRPRPGPGEVLVKVAYAGINPAEWKIREGYLASYFTPAFPFILGFDASGTVAATGPGVTGFRPGDRVVAASNQGMGQNGSYAEYTLAAAGRTVPLPAHVSLAEAATLPTAGMTAYAAVHDVGHTRAGMHVLVHGGAGGVGSFAIQLAVAAGAKVAATASSRNRPYLEALGARAIDYQQDNIATATARFAPEGVDLLIDTVGQQSLADPLALLRPGGCYAPIATALPGARFPEARHHITVAPVMSTYPEQGRQLRALVAALAARTLRAPEHQILPLAEAAEAQRQSRAGHVRGKLLLAVAPQ